MSRTSTLPKRLQPMLATLTDAPFDDPGWVFEDKYDGFRMIAEIRRGKVALYSRNGKIISRSYIEVAKALEGVKGDAVIDGELVAIGKDGGLWVADYDHNSVIKLNSADLGTTGTPTPTVTLTNIPRPEQMAFDNAGNLWIASYSPGSIIAFSAADITTSGTKTALTALDGSGLLSKAFGVRFNPGAN